MEDTQNREEWGRERSLMALGRAMRGEDETPPPFRSLLTFAAQAEQEGDRFEARMRHGLARARREAAREAEAPCVWPPEGLEEPDEQEQVREPATTADEDGGIAQAAPAAERAPAYAPRRRSWRLVAATTLLGAGLGAALAYSLPTRYQATAELTVGGDGVERLAGDAIDSQLRVLTSGLVLTRVVDLLNLAGDPEFNGDESGAGGFSGLVRAILMRDDAAPDEGHRQARAMERLAATLSVARGDGVDSIAITATTGNGEKSALIANAVADAFVQTHEQGRSGATSGSDDREPADSATATAQRQLSDFAKRLGLGDPLKDSGRIAEILALDDRLKAARARTEALNAKMATLRSVGVDSATGLPREFETGGVEALRAQYLDLKRQADSAAVKLGPRNPERRGIEAALAGARDRLSAELRRIVATQQAGLKQAVETEQTLAARLARTRLSGEDIAMLRGLQQQAAEVDRQAITASIAANDSAAFGQGAHVVSRATAPSQPSGPPRMALTLAGTLLGLFAGLGLGMLRGRAGIEAEDGADFPSNEEARFDPQESMKVAAPLSKPAELARSFGELPPASPLYQSGSFDSSAIPDSMETAMQPFYPDQAFASEQQHDQPQQWLQPAGYPPQSYAPQPMMQPLPPYPPQAYPQAWQPAPPMPPYPYVHPMQQYAGHPYPPQPSFAYATQEARPAPVIDQGAIDEIRASLHEFREALRELAESRPRRRIF